MKAIDSTQLMLGFELAGLITGRYCHLEWGEFERLERGTEVGWWADDCGADDEDEFGPRFITGSVVSVVRDDKFPVAAVREHSDAGRLFNHYVEPMGLMVRRERLVYRDAAAVDRAAARA